MHFRASRGAESLRTCRQPGAHALVRLDASRLQILSVMRRVTRRGNLWHARQRGLRTGGLSLGGARASAVTVAGACAMSVAGAAQLRGGGSSGQSLTDFGHPQRRVTDLLLALNVAMFGLQMASGHSMIAWGAKINPNIAAGEWYRLVSCTILHANLFHLYTNCSALNSLGPFVEASSGPVRMAAVYATSAIGGSLFSYWFSPAMSVGASGAIFGLGSATALFVHRHRRNDEQFSSTLLKGLGSSLLINVVIGLSVPSIDNWLGFYGRGHAGGFVGGALAAYLLGPLRRRDSKGTLHDRPPLPLLADKP